MTANLTEGGRVIGRERGEGEERGDEVRDN